MRNKKNYKKKYFSRRWRILSALAGTALLIGTGLIGTHKTTALIDIGNTKKPLKIAIMAAADIPALQRLIHGVKDYLSSTRRDYDYRTYFYDMNLHHLKRQVEEAILSQSDLIFTIGTRATQVSYKVTQSRKADIPIVFSSIYNPKEAGVAYSDTQGKENISGTMVSLSDDFIRLDKLLSLRPNMKKVGIFYSPIDTNLTLCQEVLSQGLNQRGIECQTIELIKGESIRSTLQPHLEQGNIEALFILRDYKVIEALPTLTTLCKRYKITLFAHDNYSVEQGAAAAYCSDDYVSGIVGGEIINKILNEKIPAHDIPLVQLHTKAMEKLMVNPFVLKEQGVTMPLNKIAAMSGVEIKGTYPVHPQNIIRQPV